MAEPSRREKILIGLRLAFALTEEEAENMLRQHDVDVACEVQAEINEMPDPKVWAGPLKWWRRGRDAALEVVCKDVLRAYRDGRDFDKKGHKIR